MKSLANQSDREEILRRVAALRADSPRQWGKMTAHQMMCHVNDSYASAMGLRKASSVANFFTRTVMKWGGLYGLMPWPHGVPTRPEAEQGKGGTPPLEFETDRAALNATIERFTAGKPEFTWAAHPFFGEMSVRDWMRWGYLHADHHLRQFSA